MSDGPASHGELRGGELLTAVSNAMVGLLRQHYGRGPMKAKSYVVDDILMCVMRDGLTAADETLIASGRADRVLETRREFQEAMRDRYRETVESLTGSKVVAVMSAVHLAPDVLVELFVLDPPLDLGASGSRG
mgnify:CR=1 FL=1